MPTILKKNVSSAKKPAAKPARPAKAAPPSAVKSAIASPEKSPAKTEKRKQKSEVGKQNPQVTPKPTSLQHSESPKSKDSVPTPQPAVLSAPSSVPSAPPSELKTQDPTPTLPPSTPSPKSSAPSIPSPIPSPQPPISSPPVIGLSTQPSALRTPDSALRTQDPTPGPQPFVKSSSPDDRVLHFKPPIIVRDLATRMSVKPFQLISDLMQLKILVSINQPIEPDIARKLCEKHGFKLELERRGEHVVKPVETPKEEVQKTLQPARAANLVTRPPVVTIMGHVDHGKTSLLDAIRKTNVTGGEAGGITQHLGAYTVTLPGKNHPGKGDLPAPQAGHSTTPTTSRKITFLDTPGHAAFTAMRARGANLTDIVVLVVAGDDGLMPQTLEAISHARAASVPIIVAINKIDLESAQKMKDRVKKQLQDQDLAPEDWGGKTITVEVSATKKTGIDQLLEMILLQAEVMEIKAEVDCPAEGNVLEAQMEAGRGPTATVLVRRGVLRLGNPIVIGTHWGKIKALMDDKGKMVKEAGPSMPVKIVGLSATPEAGVSFRVVGSETEARENSNQERGDLRMQKLEGPKRLTLEDLLTTTTDQRKLLKVILKTDVQGSAEAIQESLSKLPHDKVNLDVIHAAVGPITESDVLLASASKAVIVGFQVKVDGSAAETAKRESVEIQLFRIIYELTDKMTEFMSGLLDPESRVVTLGRAEVKQIFPISKGGNVAGCLVTQGRVDRKGRARVVRRKNTIFEGAISTLRRFQDDVGEVRSGLECGIRVDGFNEFEPGDNIEIYQIEKIAAKL